MPTLSQSSAAAEFALRVASNAGSRDINDASTQADAIKKKALESVQGPGSLVPSTQTLEAAAIGIAVAGLVVAYSAISAQAAVLKAKRLDFDKERQARIATFVIPKKIEERDLKIEEKVMKDFIAMATDPKVPFSQYLGIHSSGPSGDNPDNFYSVLPFYRMSEQLAQPEGSKRPLDQQRKINNLFFRAAMPEAIADIDNGFQMDWNFVSFWASWARGRNYLNNRRAPRFIMMSLSNLLWNLQHPVDPKTGFPLSLTECIAMCQSVESFLNQLLNAEERPYLQSLNNKENGLLSFVRQLETYTIGLRKAYLQQQLHELNFDEVTNSAHRTLRIMDTGVFKLIYKRYDPVTEKYEPDDRAAETLACWIGSLNNSLLNNSTLISQLGPIPAAILGSSGVNQPPQTIVDVLIIFCHLSCRERDLMLQNLSKATISSESGFYDALRKIDTKFIQPIRALSLSELKSKYWLPTDRDVGELTARRLVPFITLVMEDYDLFLSSDKSIIKKSEPAPGVATILTAKEQAQKINLSAQKGGRSTSYYYWELSPFIKTSKLDDLPKYQYRMTQVTQLMDSIKELVENYRSFLLQKKFQDFLLKCLDKVGAEVAELELRIDEADKLLDDSENVSRSLMAILRPLATDLENSLQGFRSSMVNFKKVVSASDFIKKQQHELTERVAAISDQYKLLFTESSGLSDLLEAIEPPNETSEPSESTTSLIASGVGFIKPLPPIVTAPRQPMLSTRVPRARKTADASNLSPQSEVVALRQVVQRCFNALSNDSRIGRKGLLLRELLDIIDHRSDFTKADIRHFVMELTRVTASSREAFFFQAEYGHTRSAKALIEAMKDHHVNRSLPLAAIILGEPEIELKRVNDSLIQNRFKQLHSGSRFWQEPSSQMRLRRGTEATRTIHEPAPVA